MDKIIFTHKLHIYTNRKKQLKLYKIDYAIKYKIYNNKKFIQNCEKKKKTFKILDLFISQTFCTHT